MKEKTWVNPNKMAIDTGHKAFDRQTVIISAGQHIAPTQLSFCIRPWNTATTPLGQPCKPGEMQDFDLRMFPDMPDRVRRVVRREAGDRTVIVYRFSHTYKGRQIVHGWLVTTDQPSHRPLYSYVTGQTYRSQRILDVCAEYVTGSDEAGEPAKHSESQDFGLSQAFLQRPFFTLNYGDIMNAAQALDEDEGEDVARHRKFVAEHIDSIARVVSDSLPWDVYVAGAIESASCLPGRA